MLAQENAQKLLQPADIYMFASKIYSEKAWACVQDGITQRGRLADGDMTTSP